MKKLILLSLLLLSLKMNGQPSDREFYLKELKTELRKEWPKNRTINLVFHGHSVPSGYFKTPMVNTFDSYPYLLVKKLKTIYPYAVINVIVTAIGGENSESGAKRFERDVLTHHPDLLFIDYALNDRKIGLERSFKAWEEMIGKATEKGIKVILLTPSPDQSVNYDDQENELKKHADQICKLAKERQVGLTDSYSAFDSLYADKKRLSKYMSQVNHPNELGHQIIADELFKWFN